MSFSRDQYWATLTGDELSREIINRLEQYASVRFTGIHADRVIATQRSYFGLGKNGAVSHMVTKGGVQGELSLVAVNYLRYLVQHAISRIAARKFAFEVPVEAAKYSSRAQAQMDTDVLEHYRRESEMDKKYRSVLENGYTTGEGYFHIHWDATRGETHTIDDDGREVKTGDLCVDVGSFWNYVPFDDFHNIAMAGCYIEVANKYELAAKYPAVREKILGSSIDFLASYLRRQFFYTPSIVSYDDSSAVTLVHFYHEKTAAIPDGKECILLGNGVHIYDGPLMIDERPIIRFAPADVFQRDLGYSPAFDAAGCIDAMNALKSIIISNQAAFGVQNIWIRDSNNIGPADVRGGLRFISSLEKPEPLQLTATPAEIPANVETYRNEAVQLMGLNDVALGIETTRLSGDAMDVLDDASYQYTEAPRASAIEFLEKSGRVSLMTVKANLTVPATVYSTRGKKTSQQKVSGEDISESPSIRVEITDAALSSPKGKRKFATDMAAAGVIGSKEEFIDAYVKGQSQTITQLSTSQMDSIYDENELMRQGIEPPVNMYGDNPMLHIAHHAQVLSDPLTRANPQIVQIANAHVQEHIQQWMFLEQNAPMVLQAFGVNPAMVQQQTAAQMKGAPDAAQQETQANSPEAAGGQQANGPEGQEPPPNQ